MTWTEAFRFWIAGAIVSGVCAAVVAFVMFVLAGVVTWLEDR